MMSQRRQISAFVAVYDTIPLQNTRVLRFTRIEPILITISVYAYKTKGSANARFFLIPQPQGGRTAWRSS